jgi:tetratricopeptide (TPR) repeat protein
LQGKYPIRLLQLMLAGLCLSLGFGGLRLAAQSAPQPSAPAAQQDKTQQDKSHPQDNPFPGEQPQVPAPQAQKPDATAPKPKNGSDNPFPGEDPNAPIIPVDPVPGTASGSGSGRSGSGADSGRPGHRDADPDSDPVRSPDGQGNTTTDDGFSSSRAGLHGVPAEDDSDEKPGKSTKNKTREQVVKEDVDVGGFYLDKKNWKGAQARFSAAFALDAENPDSVWGLAEAERHLQLYKEAAEHYKLFLSYEPEGRRGREARKALEEVEAAQPSASAASKNGPSVK